MTECNSSEQQETDFYAIFEQENKEAVQAAAKSIAVKPALPGYISVNGKGIPLKTIDNFLNILKKDIAFSGIRFNLLTNRPEIHHNGMVEYWSDYHDSVIRNYIESKYYMHAPEKLEDALKILFQERSYNPIKEIIEAEKWDGVDRIETLLIKWMKCEDTPYTREVSRLIFAGGINRLYFNGCKFDEVPILIGTKQGEGKSTFVRWLALNDLFFKEVREIDGQKGIEALQGAWICELSELLALTKAKEVEAVKSYITSIEDSYRKPYSKHVSRLKRQCIFIGTTNRLQFLTDKTGNRRFYPIEVHQRALELFKNENAVKNDILQCWAEALYKLDTDYMKPFADVRLINEIRAKQEDAVEDDYRVGMISDYLQCKDETCIMELWTEALRNDFTKPTRKESNDIAAILQSLDGWKRAEKPKRLLRYGIQKVWVNAHNAELKAKYKTK